MASEHRLADAGGSSRWHAQIGGDVPRQELRSLFKSMRSAGTQAFKKGEFDAALQLFNQSLAIASKVDRDIGTRGVLLHNIASCLHNLGDWECAESHYEQALSALEHAITSGSSQSSDEVLSSRLRFVRRRLQEVAAREAPGTAYLDSAGNEHRARDVQVYADEDGVTRYSADEDEATQEAAMRQLYLR